MLPTIFCSMPCHVSCINISYVIRRRLIYSVAGGGLMWSDKLPCVALKKFAIRRKRGRFDRMSIEHYLMNSCWCYFLIRYPTVQLFFVSIPNNKFSDRKVKIYPRKFLNLSDGGKETKIIPRDIQSKVVGCTRICNMQQRIWLKGFHCRQIQFPNRK